jgi:hypothetical protein
MNLIAIGILALLAVSLLISSKHFRFFVGSMIGVIALLGVVVVAFWGMRHEVEPQSTATSATPNIMESFQRGWQLLNGPSVRDTVEATSERILSKVTKGDTEDPIDNIVAPETADLSEDSKENTSAAREEPKQAATQPQTLMLVKLQRTGNETLDQISLSERISAIVENRLVWYRKQSHSPGVDKLQPRHLDVRQFLRVGAVKVDDKNVLQAGIVFVDSAFDQHVRARGLDLVKHYRLKTTVHACMWTLGSMIVLFGLLKLRQSRCRKAPTDDHLLTSGISMV